MRSVIVYFFYDVIVILGVSLILHKRRPTTSSSVMFAPWILIGFGLPTGSAACLLPRAFRSVCQYRSQSTWEETAKEILDSMFALTDSCDNVHGRPLRRQYSACDSCHLCEPADGVLYFVGGYHHQIRQLFYYNHYLRHDRLFAGSGNQIVVTPDV